MCILLLLVPLHERRVLASVMANPMKNGQILVPLSLEEHRLQIESPSSSHRRGTLVSFTKPFTFVRLGFVCLNLFGPPSRVAPSAPFPFLNFECRFFLSVIVLSPNASLCRKKEAEYLRPPVKDKLPKVEEDKGKVSSASTKSVAECLQEERDVESATEGSEFIGSDLFEENFKELKKWVDALNDMIQEDVDPPKKKLYELKFSLLEEIGRGHLVTYEWTWMHVRFQPSLLLL
ncbi:hypothetical protein CRG98_002951 [Punica granatum]|uniref:Rx N-terminal domain-containing protein n=1 Tax=Punica granatum TaxID=22663 RepID=A0A2I0L7H2_PUNGR|nr:hypothetical protein CRG98_002951 [Punica granatum]